MKSVKKRILNVKPYTPGKPIDEVKRELGLKQVIKLASNENPYGPSPKAIAAIQKAAVNLHRYPDSGCFYLRQALAKKLSIKEEQLIFGNGSDELIVLAARAFVNAGDEVLIAKPSFLIYNIASRLEGAVIKEVPLNNFRYDLKAMKKSVTAKTKIVFLGNPDNPSGMYLTQDEVESFLKGLQKNILVFIDEAYFEYVNKDDYIDSLALLSKYKNVFVSRTFSKMYGLAGLRVGYGMANAELIQIFNRLREPFNVNSLAQVGAVACLKDKAYYRSIAKDIKIQRQFLQTSLDKLGLTYYPSYTNFILVDLKQDASAVVQALLKKGVIIRDMGFWGMQTHIRVSLGTEKENRVFLKALGAVL